MSEFETFGHDDGEEAAESQEPTDGPRPPFDDDEARRHTEQVPPGYQAFDSSWDQDARDLQRRVRFAMAVLCGVRAVTFGLGLARLAVAEALDGNFAGFQGWGIVVLVCVLYGLATIGYATQEGWARVMSVIADVLILLVIVDQLSNAQQVDGVLLVVLQSVLMPTVSIVLAAKAGRGIRRPKVDDWTRDW